MAGLDEKIRKTVTAVDGSVSVSISFDRLTRGDAFVWLRRPNETRWSQVDAVRNESKITRLGKFVDLQGGMVLLVFEIVGDAASGNTKYFVSGNLEPSDTRAEIDGSFHRFAGEFDGNLRVMGIEWSIT